VRDLTPLEAYRTRGPDVVALWGFEGDATCGIFLVPSCIDRAGIRVIASSEGGWDHVSVSRQNRCPNWPEMEQIKRMFFKDDETAMQLHVPDGDHVNMHPYCLHLWRPTNGEMIPRPPSIYVGIGREPVANREEALKRLREAGL
jgi:hypothetical protein